MVEQDVEKDAPDTSSSEDDSMFTCEVCGKTFASARSLNGHMLSHRKAMASSDKDSTTSRRTKRRGESTKEPKVDYDYDESDDWEPPDALEDLKKSLLLFGLDSRNANRFCRLMENHSTENVYDLVEIADRLSWRNDQKWNFIEDWTGRRGIQIPDDILQDINDQYKSRGPTFASRRSTYPYGYGASSGPLSPAQQMTEMARAFRELKEIFEPEDSGDVDESQEVIELRADNEKLQAKLEALEQKMEFQKMLDAQKAEFEGKIKDLEERTRSKGWSSRVEDEMLDTVRDGRTTLKTVKDWLLSSADAMASQAPNLTTKPAETGGPDVADMLMQSDPDRVV